nr:unnamed protein product [Spirometra erinaceieuropaei]
MSIPITSPVWIEVTSSYPLIGIAAPTVHKAFLIRWVTIFSAPSNITTDRGAQFESNLFQSLLSFLGCARIRATAYHPAAKQIFEGFHRQLKGMPTLHRRPGQLDGPPPSGPARHPPPLKSNLDCSAAKVVFGATVRLPSEMISPSSRDAAEDPTYLLLRLRQLMWTLSPVPPRPSVFESYL